LDKQARLIVWKLIETEQTGDRTTTLGPRARVDLHVSVIEQDQRALLEVKPITVNTTTETELIPEVADQK
jgi:hypothetical protein